MTDFTRPDNEALRRRILTSTRNREMLVMRQPQNARKYASEYNKVLANVALEARNQLQLTADVVNQSEQEEEERVA